MHTKTCSRPGCDEPVAVFPSKTVHVCAAHWSELSQRNKTKAAIDPVTGETVTVGTLANRNHYRKVQAERAEYRRLKAAEESGS